jgi:Tfp pilus assembly protein PilF
MLWVNPNPETPVRAVHFANPRRKACPILIALTTVLRDEQAAADHAAAKARAKQLLDQGTAALAAGKDAAARELLEKAIREDSSLDAAYRALGNVCEKLKDEDGVLAAYRGWAAAGAKTPLPYNRIGEILEKRKDNQRALDAYQRSLQIEWNQPPVIEAKKRLEKLLAE